MTTKGWECRLRSSVGFTLMEVIIALALSMIVLMAVYGLLAKSQRSFTRENVVAESNQNLRVALQSISRDLVSAGYRAPARTAVILTDGGEGPDMLTSLYAEDITPVSKPFCCGADPDRDPYSLLEQLSSINLDVDSLDPPQTYPEQAYSHGEFLLALETNDCNDDGQIGVLPLTVVGQPVYDEEHGALRLTYQSGPLEELPLSLGYNYSVHPDCALIGHYQIIQYRINQQTDTALLERRDLGRGDPWVPVSQGVDSLDVQFMNIDAGAFGMGSSSPGISGSSSNAVKVTVGRAGAASQTAGSMPRRGVNPPRGAGQSTGRSSAADQSSSRSGSASSSGSTSSGSVAGTIGSAVSEPASSETVGTTGPTTLSTTVNIRNTEGARSEGPNGLSSTVTPTGTPVPPTPAPTPSPTPTSSATVANTSSAISNRGCQVDSPSYDESWDGVYNFSLGAKGPQHVVQGYDIYVDIESELTGGVREFTFYEVEGLPPWSTASFPFFEEHCCGGNRGYQPQTTLLHISTHDDTTPGVYPILIRVKSGGVTREICHTIHVDPVPLALQNTAVVNAPPIPKAVLAKWKSNMLEYGRRHCVPVDLWEGHVWYYDGIRVFYQIAEYTGDSSWQACAQYSKDVYRTYVLNNNGAIPGWRVFPHGLSMDYTLAGDEDSKNAALLLAASSALASKGGGVDPLRVRETAYLIHAYRIAESLGAPKHKRYDRAVDFALGHLDQWFVSKTEPYMQPFMVGLLCEALIQHYEDTGDPRIPAAVQKALDALWNWAYVEKDKAFFYESTTNPVFGGGGNTTDGQPDLNLLIAPAYAWLYRLTGNPLDQQRGDILLEGAVYGAWLARGKMFSQSYRWSFDYMKWRLNASN